MKVVPFYYDDEDDLIANCYVAIDEDNQCVVVDPSHDYDGIVNYIKKNQFNLKAVLLTHGHFDHFRGVDRLINEYNCPLYVGFYDAEMIQDPNLNCSVMLGEQYYVKSNPLTVSDGEVLNLLKEDINVLETPGHTRGSITYYFKDSKIMFTGDFLFHTSAGRCDLPSGDNHQMEESFSRIAKFAPEIKIYPGHGPSSTLGVEFETNPFLK